MPQFWNLHACLSQNNELNVKWVVYRCFLWELVKLRSAIVMPFGMHFWKWGRGLLPDAYQGEGKWAVCLKGWGEKGEYWSWKTEVNTGVLSEHKMNWENQSPFSHSTLSRRPNLPHPGKHPAVTHVPIFKSAHNMMSQLCCVAQPVSALKHLYPTKCVVYKQNFTGCLDEVCPWQWWRERQCRRWTCSCCPCHPAINKYSEDLIT